MALWRELVSFIRAEYEVLGDDGPDELRILVRYDTDEDDDKGRRSQMVVVTREILDRREEWVQIASPFARVNEVDLRDVLTAVGNTTVVGGVALIGEFVVLRHSLPLIHLDINEFTDPLELVTNSAEWLERQFIGRDEF